jgi:hypothetical protein
MLFNWHSSCYTYDRADLRAYFNKMKKGENCPMQARNKIIFFGFLCISASFLVFSYMAFEGDITIVGDVNDTQQVVADGQIYEVADTPAGDDLVLNYIAVKVKVTGTVEEKEDTKIITVKSFKAVPE